MSLGISSAHAETSVTLYGSIDTGYGYANYKYNKYGVNVRSTSSGLRSSINEDNYWGIAGSESIGSGLSAIFKLENGFDLGNGEKEISNKAFGRLAYIGLSSDEWGSFTMGRQYSAGSDEGVYKGPNGMEMGDMETVFGAVGTGGENRVDNSFLYVSPEFSGLQGFFMYAAGSIDDETSNSITVGRVKKNGKWQTYDDANRGNRISVGLSYENGPLGLGLSYDRQSNSDSTDTPAMSSWVLSGSYDFELITIMAAFGQDRHGKLGWDSKIPEAIAESGYPGDLSDFMAGGLGFDGHNFKSNNYALGVSAELGGGEIYAGWGYSSSNLGDKNAWGKYAGNISTYQINYVYPLSKRTSLYSYSSYSRNLGYLKGFKGNDVGFGLTHVF